MATKGKSAAAYVMAMDIHHFSKLSVSDHDKIIDHIYGEIGGILKQAGDGLLDKKTIGDGFVFYFSSAAAAVDTAIKVQSLFKADYIWTRDNFEVKSSCRIALHFGEFFWFDDKIEGRRALFGRNIIVAARLEPVVRANEIWCTRAFKEESGLAGLDKKISFHPLGKCELAKSWSEQEVFAIYDPKKDKRPTDLPKEREEIEPDNQSTKVAYPFAYFALKQAISR